MNDVRTQESGRGIDCYGLKVPYGSEGKEKMTISTAALGQAARAVVAVRIGMQDVTTCIGRGKSEAAILAGADTDYTWRALADEAAAETHQRRLIVEFAAPAAEAWFDERWRSKWHHIREQKASHLKARKIIREASMDCGFSGVTLRKWIQDAYADAGLMVCEELENILLVRDALEQNRSLSDSTLNALLWPGLRPMSDKDWELV